MQAMLIYLAIYVFNTLGAFGVILCLRRKGKMVEQMSDLSGLAKTNPMLALAMVIFMFSLAGVPPLAGFFGKYFIFLAAVQANMVPLAIIGVLTSVVAAYYYLRIVKVMYFDEPAQPIDPLPDFGLRRPCSRSRRFTCCCSCCGPRRLSRARWIAAQQLYRRMMDWRIRQLAETSSTNDEAKRAAEAGEDEGLVVWALKQTAGRGRHGRLWESPEGNIYCSVLLRPDCDARHAGHYSFVAALALADTVHEFLPNAAVTLKWPNDVLVDGKKISGILLESPAAARLIGWLSASG